eukprot:15485205-Alexandrium_andersonii.AAC.1
MQDGFRRSELELLGPKDGLKLSLELATGAFCAVLRAEPDGDDEKRPRRPKGTPNQAARTPTCRSTRLDIADR